MNVCTMSRLLALAVFGCALVAGDDVVPAPTSAICSDDRTWTHPNKNISKSQDPWDCAHLNKDVDNGPDGNNPNALPGFAKVVALHGFL